MKIRRIEDYEGDLKILDSILSFTNSYTDGDHISPSVRIIRNCILIEIDRIENKIGELNGTWLDDNN